MLRAANENWELLGRLASGCEDPAAEPRQLSGPERTALALLRCGRSFAEAAESSGLSVSRILDLWSQRRPH